MSPFWAGSRTIELSNLMIYVDNNDMTCGSYFTHITYFEVLKFDLWQIWKIVIIIIYWSMIVLTYTLNDKVPSTFTIYENYNNERKSADAQSASSHHVWETNNSVQSFWIWFRCWRHYYLEYSLLFRQTSNIYKDDHTHPKHFV